MNTQKFVSLHELLLDGEHVLPILFKIRQCVMERECQFPRIFQLSQEPSGGYLPIWTNVFYIENTKLLNSEETRDIACVGPQADKPCCIIARDLVEDKNEKWHVHFDVVPTTHIVIARNYLKILRKYCDDFNQGGLLYKYADELHALKQFNIGIRGDMHDAGDIFRKEFAQKNDENYKRSMWSYKRWEEAGLFR